MTKHRPIVVTQELNATVKEVWHIITNVYEMRNWYFYIDEFKPDTGFNFHFLGGDDEAQYVHLCTVTNVINEKLLSHTWRYKDYEGVSEVKFELEHHNGKTMLTLTHTGTENFAEYGKNFQRESFQKGWEYIIGTSLKEYVKNR